MGNMESECPECTEVCRHCVVAEEAGDDLPQPSPLCWDWLVHSPPQLRFDLFELILHAVASGLPLDEEVSAARFATDKSEAQKVEGLRFAKPTLLSFDRRVAAKL